MQPPPNEAVLEQFGVRVVVPLGGRRNLHWLVAAGHERLVLRRWAQPADEVAYEMRLLTHLAALGWPVAPVVAGPLIVEGQAWSLAPFLGGEPPSTHDPLAEQRARGRLLAALHADLTQLGGFGQRGAWRRCEAILQDERLDRVLAEHEGQRPDAVPILRWHLHRARERLANLAPHRLSSSIIHGDWTTWNLRFINGRLTGVLDFELAHLDHRIADFALSWRGKYDAVIHGYHEVAPLAPEEWALLTPMWWAWLLEGAYHDLASGLPDDGWTIRQLLRRSPLMGPDAARDPH